MSSDFISISPNSFSVKPLQSKHNSSFKINYLRSGGNQSVAVEERSQSPETVRIETYSPMQHYGIDGFFAMQSSPKNSSSFFSFSPNQRPNFPPPSPQNSQWDFFWNPFSSLDYYGYPTRSSLDQTVLDDEYTRLSQVREEEGIPKLEEETEQEESNKKVNMTKESIYNNVSSAEEEAFVEDVDEDDDDDDDDDDCKTDSGNETKNEEKGLQSRGRQNTEVSKAQNGGQVTNQETAVADQKCNEGTPGFTIYVKRRPTCMAEVIKDLEVQFMIVCDSASEISAILEASRAQYSSTSNELTGWKVVYVISLGLYFMQQHDFALRLEKICRTRSTMDNFALRLEKICRTRSTMDTARMESCFCCFSSVVLHGAARLRLEIRKEMIRGLTQVPWHRVDVSVHKNRQRYIGHSTIQVTHYLGGKNHVFWGGREVIRPF